MEKHRILSSRDLYGGGVCVCMYVCGAEENGTHRKDTMTLITLRQV